MQKTRIQIDVILEGADIDADGVEEMLQPFIASLRAELAKLPTAHKADASISRINIRGERPD
jgi:hypothetical protein